jgi:hypothetical protein
MAVTSILDEPLERPKMAETDVAIFGNPSEHNSKVALPNKPVVATSKLAIQAVVNYVSFYHAYLHRSQGRTNVLALQQSEMYKRQRPELTLLYQLNGQYSPALLVDDVVIEANDF